MPIRFRCTACRQLLSIGRRKAGTEIQCPKCGFSQQVPSEEEAAALAAQAAHRTQPAEPVPSGIFIFEEELEEDAWPTPTASVPSGSIASSTQDAAALDSLQGFPQMASWGGNRGPRAKEVIWISRRTLYVQAVLILVVGAVGFALGYWMGWTDTHPGSTQPADSPSSGPVLLEGRLFYRPNPLGIAPDQQAVVIVLPADRSPQNRFLTTGIRPQAPPPSPTHPIVQAIQEFGGAYARADSEGSFLVELPQKGTYYVLLISGHARRKDPSIEGTVLQEMTKYFPDPENLVERFQFRWTRETVPMAPIEHYFD